MRDAVQPRVPRVARGGHRQRGAQPRGLLRLEAAELRAGRVDDLLQPGREEEDRAAHVPHHVLQQQLGAALAPLQLRGKQLRVAA
eukprot:658373-Pyramimonas_sp.AAC.1